MVSAPRVAPRSSRNADFDSGESRYGEFGHGLDLFGSGWLAAPLGIIRPGPIGSPSGFPLAAGVSLLEAGDRRLEAMGDMDRMDRMDNMDGMDEAGDLGPGADAPCVLASLGGIGNQLRIEAVCLQNRGTTGGRRPGRSAGDGGIGMRCVSG